MVREEAVYTKETIYFGVVMLEKVQYAHKWLFVCMLEHKWENNEEKGNYGIYLEKTIIAKDPYITVILHCSYCFLARHGSNLNVIKRGMDKEDLVHMQ